MGINVLARVVKRQYDTLKKKRITTELSNKAIVINAPNIITIKKELNNKIDENKAREISINESRKAIDKIEVDVDIKIDDSVTDVNNKINQAFEENNIVIGNAIIDLYDDLYEFKGKTFNIIKEISINITMEIGESEKTITLTNNDSFKKYVSSVEHDNKLFDKLLIIKAGEIIKYVDISVSGIDFVINIYRKDTTKKEEYKINTTLLA